MTKVRQTLNSIIWRAQYFSFVVYIQSINHLLKLSLEIVVFVRRVGYLMMLLSS